MFANKISSKPNKKCSRTKFVKNRTKNGRFMVFYISSKAVRMSLPGQYSMNYSTRKQKLKPIENIVNTLPCKILKNLEQIP